MAPKYTDIVGVALVSRDENGLYQTITVFKDQEGYYYTVGVPSNLTEYSGSSKIRLNTEKRIVGVSGYANKFRIYFADLTYQEHMLAYDQSNMLITSAPINYQSDADLFPYKLQQGRSSDNIVGIGLSSNSDKIFYYDEYLAHHSDNLALNTTGLSSIVSHASSTDPTQQEILAATEIGNNVNINISRCLSTKHSDALTA